MVRASLRTRRAAEGGGLATTAVRTVVSEQDFAFPWDCRVREGESTWIDLHLDDERRAIRGSVSVDGAPEPYGVARLYRPSRTQAGAPDVVAGGWGIGVFSPYRAALDLAGHFDLGSTGTDPAWVAVELTGGPLAGTHLVCWLAEGAPAPELRLDLASAELALEGFEPGRYALLTELGAVTAVTPLASGPDGHPRPASVPAGPARLVRYGGATGLDDPLGWPVQARFDLRPGERARPTPPDGSDAPGRQDDSSRDAHSSDSTEAYTGIRVGSTASPSSTITSPTWNVIGPPAGGAASDLHVSCSEPRSPAQGPPSTSYVPVIAPAWWCWWWPEPWCGPEHAPSKRICKGPS